MRKSLFSLAIVAVLAGAGLAQAQTTTTTTTTWTNDQGTIMREYSTTKKYVGITDPAMVPTVGMVLPNNVTIYEMPATMTGMPTGQYSYTMINNNPVVVETTTRKVMHTWGPNGTGGGG